MITIVLNGTPTTTAAHTVGALVDSLDRPRAGLAVAINEDIAPRSTWDTAALAGGDRVELLAAAQGG